MPSEQSLFAFGSVRNKALFSNHWLEHRLPLEPEWNELREEARESLNRLIELWSVERDRVHLYGGEQSLEIPFIQPVLKILGWHFIYQTHLAGGKPDYALFKDDADNIAALNTDRNSLDFWTHATLVADAKAWDVSLDHPRVVNNKREYPPQQIERYLNASGLDYAILTNGRLWRLIPRQLDSHQRRFETYIECDLPKLLDDWLSALASPTAITAKDEAFDDFLGFYLFFNPRAFAETNGRMPLIVRASVGSTEYRLGVGEGLKARAFEALRYCIEGFLNFSANELDGTSHLDLCREQSFILLYRLLFIMYAEDRRLLPYRVNRLYTNNRSLGRLRDDIASVLDRVPRGHAADYSRETTAIWNDLQDLFDLIDGGRATYAVPAYNGGLFNPDAHPLLSQKRISDWHMARVIDQLSRAHDPERPTAGLFRVDYRDLAIQHLGGIYEGLLELHPHPATERMMVVSKREQGQLREKIVAVAAGAPEGYKATATFYEIGSVYLKTDKGERRASGSYYTPDHIVDHIIEQTLGKTCSEISEALRREVDEAVEGGRDAGELERDFANRILRLNVLDPAMGSGHFLIRACQYLAEEIATNPHTAEKPEGRDEESTLTYWKRRVAESCIHGVDMNGLAVELAKLALWLETVARDQPLTFLNHHLRAGNSLIGARLDKLGALPGEIALRANAVERRIEERLPEILQILGEIEDVPSDRAEQIKTKERLFASFEKAREPFRMLGDLWCSDLAPQSELTDEQYARVVDTLDRPRLFKALSEESWFQEALARVRTPDVAPFHWELEFPEVFFDETGRRENPGFDVIIGNPPYEVLSELESGRDLRLFRAFIKHEPTYEPSRVGKNNLYKLFICRSLDLLARGGHLGFITPMAVLGDEQAVGVRRKLTEVGSFLGIEAFPEKDNPRKRVFPQAKWSTAIFALVKTRSSGPFVSRIHPGRHIEDDSPSLKLTTDSIPLYDPSNFTIISCSQHDWDSAHRIMRTGRLVRLGETCTSYQGEVNETNERTKGCLSTRPEDGLLILRGSNICLYAVRGASQGETIYLREEVYLRGKAPTSKAFHGQQTRLGFQRSSPQNNFRRIIATLVEPVSYCFDTVSYVPANASSLPLPLLLGLLNSRLSDWYFRLGSTNSKVNEYQFNNLPCPVFGPDDGRNETEALSLLASGDFEGAFRELQPALEEPPFSPAIQAVVIEAVNRISAIEADRGEIARVERSALAPTAQPYQDFIDRLFFAMAGLTDDEARALAERHARMR